MPAPKLFMSLPDASNFMIGSSFDSAHANDEPGVIWVGGRVSPQRSPTQTLVPSGSIATALVEPQILPSGNVPQFSIARYGLGREFVGAPLCAWLNPPIASTAMAAIAKLGT